jgi:DNA-binding transcriptional LysR family regulator
VICAAPSYVQRHGIPKTLGDLQKHECIASRFSELTEAWVLRRQREWQTVNVRSRLLSDNGDLLRQACIAGAGIGNFYRFLVRDDIEQGRLMEVLTDYEPKPKNIYAVLPHRQIVRPQAKAFIEFVRGVAGGENSES